MYIFGILDSRFLSEFLFFHHTAQTYATTVDILFVYACLCVWFFFRSYAAALCSLLLLLLLPRIFWFPFNLIACKCIHANIREWANKIHMNFVSYRMTHAHSSRDWQPGRFCCRCRFFLSFFIIHNYFMCTCVHVFMGRNKI